MPETAFAVTPPNKIDVSHEGCSPLRLMQSAKVVFSDTLVHHDSRIPSLRNMRSTLACHRIHHLNDRPEPVVF